MLQPVFTRRRVCFPGKSFPLEESGAKRVAMNMSNTLGYLRGELKSGEKKAKRASFGKRVLEVDLAKRFCWLCITRFSVGIIPK